MSKKVKSSRRSKLIWLELLTNIVICGLMVYMCINMFVLGISMECTVKALGIDINDGLYTTLLILVVLAVWIILLYTVRGLFSTLEGRIGVGILFSKCRDDARIPSKRDEDVGYDVYASFDADELIIEPHTTAMVTTGIKSVIPKGYYVELAERSSTGKKQIKKSAGIIDSGFRGEWIAEIYNANDIPVVISKKDAAEYEGKEIVYYPYNKAIVQAILGYSIRSYSREITENELLEYESERKDKGFGSSNK